MTENTNKIKWKLLLLPLVLTKIKAHHTDKVTKLLDYLLLTEKKQLHI